MFMLHSFYRCCLRLEQQIQKPLDWEFAILSYEVRSEAENRDGVILPAEQQRDSCCFLSLFPLTLLWSIKVTLCMNYFFHLYLIYK